MRPNGKYSTNNGMNCTGFVASVMSQLGGDLEKVSTSRNGSYTNACSWNDIVDQKNIQSYRYTSISAMLASGKLEKGDLIYFEPDWTKSGVDCHIGIFWGDTSSDNKFWHSATGKGNVITKIQSVSSYKYVYVFKTQKRGTLKIYTTSADESVVCEDGNYSLQGAVYKLYNSSGKVVKTFTTDSNGAATGTDIPVGTYTLKEVTTSQGFEAKTTTYKVKIKNGEVTIKKIKKKPEQVSTDNEEAEICEHQWAEKTSKKASISKDGTKSCYCELCGAQGVNTVIPQIASVKLSATRYKYTGSAKQPKVTVEDVCGNLLTENEDYTVAYASGRTNIGKYSVTVKFQGNYSGTKKLCFVIQTTAPENASAVLYGYDDVKITWDKVNGAVGYNIYYKTSSARSYKKLGSTQSLSYNAKDLSDGVSYIFKIVPKFNLENGTIESSYYATAEATTLKKISTPKVSKAASGKAMVTWTNIYGESGYQISRSTSKNGTFIVSTYETATENSKSVSAIKGRTYYYRVRAYKIVDGKYIYGPWSSATAYKL